MWPLLIVASVMGDMSPASTASEVLIKVWTFCMALLGGANEVSSPEKTQNGST